MKKDIQNFYVGIDSGGTKCDLVILNSNNKILLNESTKAFHYSLYGKEIISENISKYLTSLLRAKRFDIKKCSGICIGLAGAREDKDKKNLERAFKKKLQFNKIDIETDTMTGLYGAFEDGDGIILISGTGSVLFGKSNDKIYRVGGWGRIIGDYGSGYTIGKEALKEVVKEYDLTDIKRKRTLLEEKMERIFDINKENIIRKIFHEKFEIQKIAPVVIKCAEKGDKVSLEIINEAVDGLLYHIKTFLKISRRKKPIDLVFIGGIIENENVLSKKLKKEINKNFKEKVNVLKKKHSSAFGAALIAKKMFP